MAIFHLHLKHVSRGKGQTLASKASYNAGVSIRCPRTDRIYNRSSRTDVSHREILLPIYADPVLLNRPTLVQAIEGAEKRRNARLALDIEMSLPIELTTNANLDLACSFAKRMFVDHGFVVDVCVHKLLEKNPHCHMLIATRQIMPNGEFARVKDRSRRTKCWIVELRKAWADAVNQALQQAGHLQRISHMSNQDQQLEQLPTIHIGPCSAGSQNHGVILQRKAHNTMVRVVNRMIIERQMLLQALQQLQVASQAVQFSTDSMPSSNSDNSLIQADGIGHDYLNIGYDRKFISIGEACLTSVSEMKHSERDLPVTSDVLVDVLIDPNFIDDDQSNDENEIIDRPAM